jgi:hypothetical protein
MKKIIYDDMVNELSADSTLDYFGNITKSINIDCVIFKEIRKYKDQPEIIEMLLDLRNTNQLKLGILSKHMMGI